MMSSRDSRPAKVLSCASCRQRKTKCDKVQPVCSQCSRFDLECVYPARKPTRRAPRPRQSELLDRISRLETIVGQADPEKLRLLDEAIAEDSAGGNALAIHDVGDTDVPARVTKASTSQSSPGKQDGVTPSAARYLSNEFWGNLCAEVEGIKQALDQPSDEEDEDDCGDSPESLDVTSSTGAAPSGYVFGNPNYAQRDRPAHPSRDVMSRLWAIYVRHVDPLIKVLHRPTITKYLQFVAEDPVTNALQPHTNALLFAVYFSASTCLSPEMCLRELGESQDVLVPRYRLNVERALADADYLNNNELECLQAFTLYAAMMRCHCHSRSSWALTSLVVRLAQAQELNRDGDGHRFTPFVAEMRRRLWHFIMVLDIRGSEDRGSDALLTRSSYNTVKPTPIDDEDFGPDSTAPLVPKTTGPAENVICMCTSMCSSIFGYLTHPPTDAEGSAKHFIHTENELIKYVRILEQSFIHTADPAHLPSLYASEISRIVILKLWLNIQYPFSSPPPIQRPRVSRDTMLRTAISVIELNERMTGHQWVDRFGWWTDTYVQWHPLAVALAELCVQTEGELVDKAWVVVDRFVPHLRETIADSARGSLWRPIRKLLKKAREARTKALMKGIDVSGLLPTSFSSARPLTAQEELQEQLMKTMTLREPMPNPTQGYDSMTMDPSYLFEYPPELLNNINFDPQVGLNNTVPMEWATWAEFLNDTQMSNSPEGSGGGDSI